MIDLNPSNIKSGDKYLPTFVYMKNGQPLDPYEYTKMNIQAVLANCSKKRPDVTQKKDSSSSSSSDNEEDKNEKVKDSEI